jgi:putative PIN family toxin of toxin-antitoxin system
LSAAPPRTVFDCNIYLQSILNKNGPAARCMELVDSGEIVLFISAFVLTEIRKLPHHRKLMRFTQMTDEKIAAYLNNLVGKAISLNHVPSARLCAF